MVVGRLSSWSDGQLTVRVPGDSEVLESRRIVALPVAQKYGLQAGSQRLNVRIEAEKGGGGGLRVCSSREGASARLVADASPEKQHDTSPSPPPFHPQPPLDSPCAGRLIKIRPLHVRGANVEPAVRGAAKMDGKMAVRDARLGPAHPSPTVRFPYSHVLGMVDA